MLEGLPYPSDEQRKCLRSKTLLCHTDFRRCNVLNFVRQFPYSAFHFGPFGIALARTYHERSANYSWTVRSAYICQMETGRILLDTPWTVCRLLVRCEPGVMYVCRCCRDAVVIVIVNVHYQEHFREITSNAPSPSVHLDIHSVTCNPHAVRALLLRSLPQRSPTIYSMLLNLPTPKGWKAE